MRVMRRDWMACSRGKKRHLVMKFILSFYKDSWMMEIVRRMSRLSRR